MWKPHCVAGCYRPNAAHPNEDVVEEVMAFLEARIVAAEAAGIARECLVIDPG